LGRRPPHHRNGVAVMENTDTDRGQIFVDMGGNQLMLHKGPVG
jgi:hypothetical protein